MDDTAEIKPKVFARRIARIAWVTGIIAIGLIVSTGGTPAKLVGEIAALTLICAGFLLGIAALASIPKYGTNSNLPPATLGIMINGLLLAIAIPNFLHARKLALERQEGNWRQCQLVGLEFLSPLELTNDNTIASLKRAEKYMQMSEQEKFIAEENIKRLESYRGQLGKFAVQLNRTTLLPEQNPQINSITAQITQAMQQQFPLGFQSINRDAIVDGNPATRMTLQFQIQGQLAKAEYLIILKRPYLWQIQIFGPAGQSQYSETVEKIFNSIKLLPTDFKSSPLN